jgi:hypothetical protein
MVEEGVVSTGSSVVVVVSTGSSVVVVTGSSTSQPSRAQMVLKDQLCDTWVSVTPQKAKQTRIRTQLSTFKGGSQLCSTQRC